MVEINLIEVLMFFGFVYLLSYLVFIKLINNQRLHKVHQRVRNTILIEKELDKTEAIKRLLFEFNSEKIEL
jgi:hypothetical protein